MHTSVDDYADVCNDSNVIETTTKGRHDMFTMTRQQTKAMSDLLANAGNIVAAIIDPVTSETLRGAISVTFTYPGARPAEVHLVNGAGNVVRFS